MQNGISVYHNDCMSTAPGRNDIHPPIEARTPTQTHSATCSLSHPPYQGPCKHQARLKWKALITSVITDIARWLLAREKRWGIPSRLVETPDNSRRRDSYTLHKLETVYFSFLGFT